MAHVCEPMRFSHLAFDMIGPHEGVEIICGREKISIADLGEFQEIPEVASQWPFWYAELPESSTPFAYPSIPWVLNGVTTLDRHHYALLGVPACMERRRNER